MKTRKSPLSRYTLNTITALHGEIRLTNALTYNSCLNRYSLPTGAREIQTMSTFNGIVYEYPQIRVDRFEPTGKTCKHYFLSHCHTDHMEGLDRYRNDIFSSGGVKLYGSPITVRILKNTYPDLKNNVKELSVECPEMVRVNEKGDCVMVTTIPAGHCPGSVMFLFEGSHTVLYTGDFRINVADLPKYVHLHRNGKTKRLDNLYLDTTFCHEKYEHFPSRAESANALCELVEMWLNLHEDNTVFLKIPAYFGCEYLFVDLFGKLSRHIHVLPKMHELYKYVPELARVITLDHSRARIHASLKMVPCCSFANESRFLRTIYISALSWDHYVPGKRPVRKLSSAYESYGVCCSQHSSLSEIVGFVRYLRPDRIEPCVVPVDCEESCVMVETLERLMKEFKSKEGETLSGTNENCREKKIRRYSESTSFL